MSINTLAHVFTPHGNIVYTANDFRQTVRIAVAGTIALSISTFYDVQYGVFFVVYPLMLMSLVPVFNRHVARQFVFSAAVNCVEMVLIVGYLSQWPVIMTLVVFLPILFRMSEYVGDLPVIGNAFRNTSRSNNRTELLVFLTPRVVTDTAMAR